MHNTTTTAAATTSSTIIIIYNTIVMTHSYDATVCKTIVKHPKGTERNLYIEQNVVVILKHTKTKKNNSFGWYPYYLVHLHDDTQNSYIVSLSCDIMT